MAIAQPGLIKMPVPLATLDRARPGLEDLRILDPSGQETPYYLDQSRREPSRWRAPKEWQSKLVNNAGSVLEVVTGLQEQMNGVEFESPAPTFVKATQIEVSADGREWEVAVRDEIIFRQAGVSRLALPLPAGSWSHLRIQLDDRRSPPIPVSGIRLQLASVDPPAEAVELKLLERIEEPARTRLVWEAPSAHLWLSELSIETPERLFKRDVHVLVKEAADQSILERRLTSGSIFHMRTGDGPTISNSVVTLEVPLPNRTLVLVIDNGDSPPLQISRATAKYRPVRVAFAANAAGEYVLLSGNRLCPPPRYDLASLAEPLKALAPSPLAASGLSNNAAYLPVGLVPSTARQGAPLDVSDWEFRKQVKTSGGGVHELELDLEVLAGARDTLADLRLVADGVQVPFVLDRSQGRRSISPVVTEEKNPERPSVSRWKLTLPQPNLPLETLVCRSGTPLFQRRLRLLEWTETERGERWERSLAEVEWRRSGGDGLSTVELLLPNRPRTKELFLETDNGANRPIQIEDVKFTYTAAGLIFNAPEEELFLHYGNPKVAAATYDVELLAAELSRVDKQEATLSEAQGGVPTRWYALSGGKPVQFAFWAVLIGVTASLLWLIVRLLPKQSGG